MRRLIFTMLLSATFGGVMAQKKDTFMIKSLPVFDMDGNVYYTVRYYDHPPTAKDSLLFEEELEKKRKITSDSINAIKQKKNNKVKQKVVPRAKN